MVANRLLFLLIVIGLVTGCATETLFQREVEPVFTPVSIPSPLSTRTRDLEPQPATETPEMSTDEVDSDTPFLVESEQPPVDERRSPRSPVEGARRDLARRLRVDLVWVEVVETIAREPDAEVMSCLSNGAAPEQLWANLDEVQWITLSVGGKIHHYLVLENLTIYCQAR